MLLALFQIPDFKYELRFYIFIQNKESYKAYLIRKICIFSVNCPCCEFLGMNDAQTDCLLPGLNITQIDPAFVQ